jgi:hypothetical protein
MAPVDGSELLARRTLISILRRSCSSPPPPLVSLSSTPINWPPERGNKGTAGNQLLQIYRGANQQSRTTPVPDHFNERWNLPYSFLDNPQVVELIVDPPSDEPTVKPVVEGLQKDAEALLAQYSTLLHQYPNPTAMVEGFK